MLLKNNASLLFLKSDYKPYCQFMDIVTKLYIKTKKGASMQAVQSLNLLKEAIDDAILLRGLIFTPLSPEYPPNAT